MQAQTHCVGAWYPPSPSPLRGPQFLRLCGWSPCKGTHLHALRKWVSKLWCVPHTESPLSATLGVERGHCDQASLDVEDCPGQARKGKQSELVVTTIGFSSKWCHGEMLPWGERILPNCPWAMHSEGHQANVCPAPCRALETQTWIRPGSAVRGLRMRVVVVGGGLTPHADSASAQASPRSRACLHVPGSPRCGPVTRPIPTPSHSSR